MTSVVPSGSSRPTSFYSRTLRLSATTFLLKSGMSTAELQTWGISELTFPERVPLGSPRVGTSCMCCQCGGRAPGPRLRLSAFPATRCILALQHELLAWPQSLTLAVELTACPISGPGCLCEQAGGSWHGAQSQVQRLGSGTVEPPCSEPSDSDQSASWGDTDKTVSRWGSWLHASGCHGSCRADTGHQGRSVGILTVGCESSCLWRGAEAGGGPRT